MIKALLHKKLKHSFLNPRFTPSEDSLTSSVIGLMQYLPDEVFWLLLKSSCGNFSDLNQESGKLISIEFWKKFMTNGADNSLYVEPDVFCRFENFDLIIEAKKGDAIGQYPLQWQKEIAAYLEDKTDDQDKKLILIALGGNNSLKRTSVNVNHLDYEIYAASWQRLLSEIEKYSIQLLNNSHSGAEYRILSDIILSFEKHHFFHIKWLHELKDVSIKNDSINTMGKWNFDHRPILSDIAGLAHNNNISSAPTIFSLWKTH